MKKQKQYALYKGDTFIDIGTKEYLANKIGVDTKSIEFYMSPTYQRRNNSIFVLEQTLLAEFAKNCICGRLLPVQFLLADLRQLPRCNRFVRPDDIRKSLLYRCQFNLFHLLPPVYSCKPFAVYTYKPPSSRESGISNAAFSCSQL